MRLLYPDDEGDEDMMDGDSIGNEGKHEAAIELLSTPGIFAKTGIL